jgi:hypothetical protein
MVSAFATVTVPAAPAAPPAPAPTVELESASIETAPPIENAPLPPPPPTYCASMP